MTLTTTGLHKQRGNVQMHRLLKNEWGGMANLFENWSEKIIRAFILFSNIIFKIELLHISMRTLLYIREFFIARLAK